jgi:hypothetical protein
MLLLLDLSLVPSGLLKGVGDFWGPVLSQLLHQYKLSLSPHRSEEGSSTPSLVPCLQGERAEANVPHRCFILVGALKKEW